MKTILLILLAIFIAVMTLLLAGVTYLLFDEVRDTWEVNRLLRRKADGEREGE